MDEQHHSTATSTTTTTTTPPPTIAVQTDDVDPTVAVATRSGLNVSIDDDHDDERRAFRILGRRARGRQ